MLFSRVMELWFLLFILVLLRKYNVHCAKLIRSSMYAHSLMTKNIDLVMAEF